MYCTVLRPAFHSDKKISLGFGGAAPTPKAFKLS